MSIKDFTPIVTIQLKSSLWVTHTQKKNIYIYFFFYKLSWLICSIFVNILGPASLMVSVSVMMCYFSSAACSSEK